MPTDPDDQTYAYLLTDDDLERLPRIARTPLAQRGGKPREQIDRLATWIAENAPGEPSRSEGAVDTAIRLLAAAARRSAEWEGLSRAGRQQVGALVEQATGLREQLTAARQERDEARRQLVEQGEAAEEQVDALRAEVARLSGLLDESEQRVVSMTGKRDELRAGLVEFVANLAAEDWGDRADDLPWLLQRPRKIAASIEELVLGERVDPAPTRDERLSTANPDRPMPGANAWPDDAVLLTYPEVRRLVALHLDVCRQTMPREKPWEWIAARVTAVRDGEVPLLLAEVLDR